MEQNTSQEAAQESPSNNNNLNEESQLTGENENIVDSEANQDSLVSVQSSNETNEQQQQPESPNDNDGINQNQQLNRENSVESILPFILNRLNSFYLNAGIDFMDELFNHQSLASQSDDSKEDEKFNQESFFNVS